MSFTESLSDIVQRNENGLLGSHHSWERVALATIAKITNGFPFPSSRFTKDEGVPLLRIRDVMTDQTVAFYDGDFEPSYLVEPEDLVVGMDGDFNCALWTGPQAVLNQRVCKIAADERYYDRRLLAYVLPGYLRAINAKTSSLTVKHLSSKTIEEIPLPLPPPPEQHRIVAEIEKQFTRLDAAVAALESAQAKLKRYRASVLKAACEGRLVPTEADLAREEGRDYEPADMLLERVLQERRSRWEDEQLEKTQAAGKPPKNDRWKAKYKEPAAADLESLPALPEGWTWATMDQLVLRSEYGTSVKCDYDADGPPVLRIPNIAGGTISLSDIKRATRSLLLKDDDWLRPGDLLMCRTNGSISLVGKTALVTKALVPPHTFASYLLRFRLFGGLANWIDAVFGSPFGRSFIESNAASSAGQNNVSLSLIHGMYVPLPPVAEIPRIISEQDRRLSLLNQLEVSISHALRRAGGLRQSILKRAFEGKLVPQDPNDEPAKVLLERIRSERKEEVVQAIPRRKRRAGRKTT